MGKRLGMPKLSKQNAPTRGKRRRRVEEEEEKVRMQHSVEAICEKQ